MSKNIDQVFIANPITVNASTDLMYFGQSPYSSGADDAAMTFANFSAQFGAPYTAAALTKTDDTNVTLTLGGSPTTALLHAASITAGWTGTLSGTRGGTGVNNGASTITLGGSLTTSGAFASTFTMTNTTSVTFPTSGTLATTSQIPSLPLSLANGGTNASLVASNGGIFYSTGSAGAILSGTATANQVLLSGSSTAPAWSTATYPATTTAGRILYSSSTNTIGELTTTARAVLASTSASAPNWLVLTDGQIVVGSTAGQPAAASLSPGAGITITPGSNSISIAASSGSGSPLTTKGDLYTFSTVNTRLAVGTVDGQILQVSSGAATGLAYSTPTYPSASGSAGKILISDGTNNIYSTPTYPNTGGTSGSIIISDGTNKINSTSLWPNTVGTAGKIIRSDGTTNAYTTSTFADTYAASTILYSNGANTVTGLATTNSASLTTTAAGVPVWLAQTDGQVIVGSSAGAPAAATLSAGTGISITNGHNTITIAATGSGETWSTITTSQAAAINNSYFTNSGGLITLTLPATAALGSVVEVAGQGAGGWTLAANTGQTIQFGNLATTSGGSFSSTNQFDTIRVVCQVANTTWQVLSSVSAGLTKA